MPTVVEELSDSDEDTPLRRTSEAGIGRLSIGGAPSSLRPSPVVEEPTHSDDDEETAARGGSISTGDSQVKSSSQRQLDSAATPLRTFEEDFERHEEIGRGVSGVVYRATPRDGGSEAVAVKVIDIRRWRLAGIEPVQVCREVEVLGRLNHPNIVTLHAVYRGEMAWYLVMDFVRGQELFAMLFQQGPLSEAQARPVFRQVGEALAYLHGLAIVHRDVKPENVLVLDERCAEGGELQVKLLDFGLSKHLGTTALGRTYVGTEGYVAPEIQRFARDQVCMGAISDLSGVDSKEGYDYSVDMYALGATLYVILMAEPAPRFGLVGDPLLLSFPPDWDDLSGDARDLVSSLMAYSPERRPDAAAALRHSWLSAPPRVASNMSNNNGRPLLDGAPKVPRTSTAGCDVGTSRSFRSVGLAHVSLNDVEGGRLQLAALRRMQRSISQALVEATAAAPIVGPCAVDAVRKSSHLCRMHLQRSVVLLDNVRATARTALELLEDVQLAISEGKPTLAREFFSSLAAWLGELRVETITVQQDLRSALQQIVELASFVGVDCSPPPLLAVGTSQPRVSGENTCDAGPLQFLAPFSPGAIIEDARPCEPDDSTNASEASEKCKSDIVKASISLTLNHMSQIDSILESAISFWGGAQASLTEQMQRGDHFERFLSLSMSSAALRERLADRFEQYRLFWLRALENADAFQRMSAGLCRPYFRVDSQGKLN